MTRRRKIQNGEATKAERAILLVVPQALIIRTTTGHERKQTRESGFLVAFSFCTRKRKLPDYATHENPGSERMSLRFRPGLLRVVGTVHRRRRHSAANRRPLV